MDGARPVERGVAKFFNAVKERLQAGAIRSLRGRTMELILHADNEAEGRARALCDGAFAFAIDLPKAQVADPLLDPDFARQIARLREILPQQVKGQDDAVERTIEALTSWLSLPVAARRPLGLFWVGPTGVGKTELARAISLALFESRERAEIIPFGEVSNEHRLNQVIGAPPGTIGSDEVRAFERALRNMPDGGVLVFDEISNMGENVATRDALFKRLYHPFEEGRWTSSATGETYDLSKYVVVADGQRRRRLFQGDRFRRDPRADLAKAQGARQGAPDAGRSAACRKPFSGAWPTSSCSSRSRTPSPGTWPRSSSPASSIATPRSESRFAWTRRSPATSATCSTPPTRARAACATWRPTGSTTSSRPRCRRSAARRRCCARTGCASGSIAQLPDRPFVRPDDPKPKVEFVVEVGAQGSVAPRIVVAKDYTQFAALPKRLSEAQARATAYHEAGHAVVNDPAVTGQKLTWLTILGDVGNLGFALYDEDEDRPVHVVDRRRAVLRLARLMAGQTAMTMAGFAPDAGWAADLRAARQLARRMILEWGLDPEFLGVAPAHDTGRNDDPHLLSQRQIDRLSDTIVRLLAEALKEAEGELGRNWDLVEALVSSLMDCGYVSGDTFDQLREQCPSRGAAGHPKIVGVDVCARLLAPTGI